MRIWIDLANSPHVPFFRALANELNDRGHEIGVTARDFAETVGLAQAAGFSPEVISGHGGRELVGKAGNLLLRDTEQPFWDARRHRFPHVAVSGDEFPGEGGPVPPVGQGVPILRQINDLWRGVSDHSQKHTHGQRFRDH